MIKRTKEYEMLPAWYGIFYNDYMTRTVVCLPMPLNVIARVLRSIAIWVKCGSLPVSMNPRDAYTQGFNAGKQAAPIVKE